MLGAVAEFERALIRERTVAGLKHAKSQGRVGGNPGLRAKDPDAIAKLQATRRQTRLDQLSDNARMHGCRSCASCGPRNHGRSCLMR